MQGNYARDLDLNLLRVFVVVAEHGSVTQAAARLYLTQPAVSAALRRLTDAVGASLFTRRGRGLALTARGEQLLARSQVHLTALVDAALSPAGFDPKTSERTLRLGLADAAELWLLPILLRDLARDAPGMRVVSIPVNFRTVGDALMTQRLDAAITVADELPPTIRREELHGGTFVCLFDPRHARLGRATEADYFAAEHVVVSYNGDLRGVVEDVLRKQRRIRCSVSSFANVGAIVDGSALVATVPDSVAAQLRQARPHLRSVRVPFQLSGNGTELLWPHTTEDDEASQFVRARIREVAALCAPKKARIAHKPRRARRG